MKVSVLIMTYNHERYVGRALDGALMQQTSFPFEILVSEDASTDATRSIVQEYAARHPDKIRLILSERNVHTNEIVTRGLRAARGDYVALLDGDDFWTAPDKLQAQADFLDANPDCALCVANSYVVDEAVDPVLGELWTSSAEAPVRGFDEMLHGNPFTTNTAVLRRNGIPLIGDWYTALFPATDWPLYLHQAQYGSVCFINRPLGAYRLHAGGLYSPLSRATKLRAWANLYDKVALAMPERARAVRRAGFRSLQDFAWAYLREGDAAGARLAVRLALGLGWPSLRAAPELVRFAIEALLRRAAPPAPGPAP